MSATGTWNLIVKTPMGEQKLHVQLLEEGDTLTGTVEDGNQPATDIKMGTVDGNQLGWKFDVKRPFPTTVTIAVQVDGRAMSGTAKAGMFPPARVSGTRSE